MSTEAERRSLYSSIALCPLQCEGIVNDREAGLIPRSYFWGEDCTGVDLLIVSKNPANAPSWESALYSSTPPERLAEVHLEIVRDVFSGRRSVPSNYHANLLRRVAAILGVEATPTAVFGRTAMTALAKCQSSGAKTAKIPGSTYSTCAERHLFREIAHFKPVYLLALGKEPYEFLVDPSIVSRHGLPVGKLWHPSWSNMPGGEAAYFANELAALHRQFVAALASRESVAARRADA